MSTPAWTSIVYPLLPGILSTAVGLLFYDLPGPRGAPVQMVARVYAVR